jgi:hypothetical protein
LSHTTNFARCVITGLIVASLLALFAACGDKEEEPPIVESENPYLLWKEYNYGNMRILYQANHPDEARLEEIARNYEAAIRRISGELDLPPLTDTILFLYYTGYGQGRQMTGSLYPFATDTAIHFWLPSFPGPVLMQYLLPRWSPQGTRFSFLHHGLIALYDYSGQDYHLSTVGYINRGQFISLDSLARDTTIDSNTERHQTALAASFAAFIIGQTGAPGIKALYEERRPFPEAVQYLFGITVDSLQQGWLQFVKSNVPEDSIRDSLWD